MTAASLRTFFRFLTNEQDSTRIADTTVDLHFQAALEAFNRRVGYKVVENGSAITITAGATDKTVPTDFEKALVVEWNAIPLQPGHWREWRKKSDSRNWRSKGGSPAEYMVEGRQMFFFPVPNAEAVSVDATIFLRYVAAAGTFGDTELAFIGDQSHRILAYFAAAEWVENPANSILGAAYAQALYQKFEVETKEVRSQYAFRELEP